MPIGDGRIAAAIFKDIPFLGPILGAAVPVMIEEVRNDPDISIEQVMDAVAPAVAVATKTDPVVVNSTNGEKPWQSGTTLGMTGGLFTSLGAIYATINAGIFDPAILGPQIAAALGCAYGLYRRWWPGLKPLFSR